MRALCAGADHLVDYVSSTTGKSKDEVFALSSGRVAIYLALQACEVSEGSSVAVNAMCCNSVLGPIQLAGARPVYVDSEDGTFCMSAGALSQAMERQPVKAVVCAHFVGQRSDMSAIAEVCKVKGVTVIDDSAYLAGARIDGGWAGLSAPLGLWSFNSKLLSGQGGAVLFANEAYADYLRAELSSKPAPTTPFSAAAKFCFRNIVRRLMGSHIPGRWSGQVGPKDWRVRQEESFPEPGKWNASPWQRRIMHAQLRRSDQICSRLKRSMEKYREELAGSVFSVATLPHGGAFARTIPIHWPAEGDAAAAADFSLAVRRFLHQRGVQSLFYVPQWWWDDPSTAAECPACAELWGRTLYLPNHPLLTDGDIVEACRVLKDAWASCPRDMTGAT